MRSTIYYPNAFTPNDDKLNDLYVTPSEYIKEYEIRIYNRWGEKVFESDENNVAWDGKDALPGYYMYQIFAYDFRNNLHVYKGSVYLLE